MIRQKLCGAFAVGALAMTAAGAASAADVQVDPATKYQKISGWETMLRSWEIDKVNNKYDSSWAKQSPKVLDRLVNELGINRVRLEYRSGYENPTDYWGAVRRRRHQLHRAALTLVREDQRQRGPEGGQSCRVSVR